MIVVVGNPLLRPSDGSEPAAAAGPAVAVAAAAVQAGAAVQLAGKIGDDPAGEHVILGLTRLGIGHVAVLRDPADQTGAAPVEASAASADDLDEGTAALLFDEAGDAGALPGGPAIAPADLDLALRYLTSFGVLVVAEPVPPATLAIAVESAAYAGAQLIVVGPTDPPRLAGIDGATILEPPPADPDGAFATLVGRYAAGLDSGVAPDEAFRAALDGAAWEAATT